MKAHALELSVFFRCVNACAFCSNREAMDAFAAHPLSLEEITRTLARHREAGCEHVTFTGGEPTLYPRFWEVLQRAKALGLRTHVISNGSALANPGYAARVLPYLDELCLSLHGPDAATHDAMTLTPGSFARMEAALRAIDAHGGPLFLVFNTVATRLNLDGLEATVTLACSRRQTRQIWVSCLIPEGEGLRRFSELSVPNWRIVERLPALARRTGQHSILLRVFGIPQCVLGPYREFASELYWNPSVAVTRAWAEPGRPGLREEANPQMVQGRIKTVRCRGCARAASCGGLFRRYHREFGDWELRPIYDDSRAAAS